MHLSSNRIRYHQQDGTSILAVDSISGVLLWKRQIESVVAAVYGVGKASTWVPLDVIEESEVLTDGLQKGAKLLPSSKSDNSHSGGGLVPYGSIQTVSEQSHRLGRHRDHLFVSSKFDPLGMNPPPFPESDLDDATNYMDEHGEYHEEVLPPKQAPLFAQAPYSLPFDVAPPVSHRTEHGLYLTWSMISAILALLLSLVVYARYYYMRQKKKWENTPTLAPTAPNSYENHATDQSMSPRGNFLAAASLADDKRSFPGAPWWRSSSNGDKINTQPPSRSLSLGAIGNQAETTGKSFIPEKSSDSPLAALSPKPNAVPLFRDGNKNVKSLAGITSTASPTITRSLTVPPEDDQSKQPDIDNIDGVPLVRYSRYRSEFKELSALGRGGFGTVFKCENALDSREYAIKKIWIKSQVMDDGKVTKHFSQKLHRVLREVKILALLDHPNIVRYYTAWLEVDNEDHSTKADGDESNILSSRATFSGFGSTSRGPSLIFKAGGNLFSKSNKGISSYMPKSNPLGWSNFASFRLDESKSASRLSNVNENTLPSSADGEDDLGFEWERSGGHSIDPLSSAKYTTVTTRENPILNEGDEESSSDSSGVSSVDSKESGDHGDSCYANSKIASENKLAGTQLESVDKKPSLFTTERRHVLYIQMQLCSVQTLADFLGNREARMGSLGDGVDISDSYAVDIPFALRLFSQITHGVKYVHKQGLIHRDLKPQVKSLCIALAILLK